MSLENLIDAAGLATTQPPEPSGGIPPQKIPPWIRWPVRLLFLPFILLDLQMQKVARFMIRPPFKKAGGCLKRGNCCHYILLPKAKGILEWASKIWNMEINGFYLRSQETVESEDGKEMYVMGCRYLQKNGKCGRYFFRPMVCRKWPLIEYFGYPRLLKGCGYKPVLRSAPVSFGVKDMENGNGDDNPHRGVDKSE